MGLVLQLALAVDMYKVLDCSSASDQAEIKRAYRKQSLLYHPDKNPGTLISFYKVYCRR